MSNYQVINFGDLNPGDEIVGSDGELTEITDVYDKHIPDRMYELEMEDGQVFKASGDHLWYSETEIDEKNKEEYIRLAKEFFDNHGSPKPIKEDKHYELYEIVSLFGDDIPTRLFIEKACRSLGYSSFTPIVHQEMMKSGEIKTIEDKIVYKYSYNDLVKFLKEMRVSLKNDNNLMFGEVRTTDEIFKLARHMKINIPTLEEVKKRRSFEQ